MPLRAVRIAVLTTAAVVAPIWTRVADESPLQLRLIPAACQEPCNVRVRVVVKPAADNRALAITAESASYLRRSIVPLEGRRAARLHVMLFQALPAGTYTFEARVDRASAADLIEALTVVVRGGSPD
jgi:hypothetical protein